MLKKPTRQSPAPWLKFFPEIVITVIYLGLHFFQLLQFPVFADEAIYIRWSQLILDDAHRYLFFPMNDGKTPLFIWLLAPFQLIFHDQLWAARFVSVMIGLAQVFVTRELIRVLGGRHKAQWFGMLLVSFLPFWFFYHRVALMDGLLTLFVSLSFYGLIRVQKLVVNPLPAAHKQRLFSVFGFSVTTSQLGWAIFTGVTFGLAIWSKVPALFLIPSFSFVIFLSPKAKSIDVAHFWSLVGGALILGLALFASLRISPSFIQLFRRSTDFTYSISDVLAGKWHDTLPNIWSYLSYLNQYLTLPVIVLALAGLFSNRFRRTTIMCLLAAACFGAPFWILGKVIYARYFLPLAIFFTVPAALNFQALYDRWYTQEKNLVRKTLASLVLVSLLGGIVGPSASFIGAQLFDVDHTPFVSSDRTQYLETWSSGHGIAQTAEYIRQQSQQHSIAVATEGRFGTLPDGLLLYFHGQDVHNIYIEGTGEFPVKTLPTFFTQRAQQFDQTILVVNSDRMGISLPANKLIHEYCRPDSAPCLQLWDVTALVKAVPSSTY